jgi:hypothetical protein
MDDYRAGRLDGDQIHIAIGAWHEHEDPRTRPPLASYLGMSAEQFKQWADTGELPAGPHPNREQRQALHERQQGEDPAHDLSSCWCCCEDCHFPSILIAVDA